MAVPATLDNRTEGCLKRSTDGDELKNTLIIPDRRNAHCTTPLSCYQGQAPSGWLRSSLARNLRTIFADRHIMTGFLCQLLPNIASNYHYSFLNCLDCHFIVIFSIRFVYFSVTDSL